MSWPGQRAGSRFLWVNPGQPIKTGLFKGQVRLKIRNGKWEAVKWDECGSHVVGCFVQRKGSSHHHLLTKFIYPLWLHHKQPSCLSFLNHQFCAGMNTTCWKPRSTVLAPVASLSPKTMSLVCPPLDDQDLLTKRKRVSEELR